MSVLDFKEIPEAHKATGEQDKFELFARDFFTHLGYKIIREPGRGADGGVDILMKRKEKVYRETLQFDGLLAANIKLILVHPYQKQTKMRYEIP